MDMTIEVDVKEIKELLFALSKKLDALIETRETLSLMMLAERSLTEFLEKEPEIYSVKDVKVRYR